MIISLSEQNSSYSFPEFKIGVVAGYPEPTKQEIEDALGIIFQYRNGEEVVKLISEEGRKWALIDKI